MPPAILIHGRKGVGKDTLARHLHLQHGYFQTAIADVLRLFLEESNPPMLIDGQQKRLVDLLRDSGWDEAKRRYPEVRDLLKDFGQAARNVFGEDFWAERYVETLRAFRRDRSFITHFIVSDVRYENELDLLRFHFGPGTRAVKIVRPGHDADGHPSEDGLPDELFDMVLENNGSPHSLFAKMQYTLFAWGAVEEAVSA